MNINKRTFLVAIPISLALALAGCGGAASTGGHGSNPKPAPSSHASPGTTPTPAPTPASNGLSLAAVSSASYKPSFPGVTASQVPSSYYTAWQAYVAGDYHNTVPSPTFLATTVPSNFTVKNDDPALTQAQANQIGRAYLDTSAWTYWGYYYGAPQLVSAVGMSGTNSTAFSYLQQGYRIQVTNGNSVFPTQMVIVPLSSTEKSQLQTSTDFALVTVLNTTPQTLYLVNASGQSQTVVESGSELATVFIYTGSVASDNTLGLYFKVVSSTANCSTLGAPECAAAGVS